ncbi:FAD-dependent oxidoreductase [Deferribacter autotrophicus]|uniref:Glycerol-3-phosphate dehydrogenase n=1 Tax=Deferribacter autotrophicus TaxID=500465 RepID=A0A5A8F0Z0_9BACT|nr:FAD-dependent oxidoreductase [Deferribacter autotrophicus]KAA0256920.1 FAD-dependent oxidoreductase [Deferribacter autotrophicus]
MKSENSQFDIIVIGGGATGCGVALDAASRGFKTLLLEKNDFASGTSSRSTKLLHGGVRYLESAIKHLDKEQYNLVKSSLRERYLLIQNAPHLCHKIALLTPLYKWYEIPYIFTGLTIYDLLSGKKTLGRSKIISKKRAIKEFPSLKKDGLKGCVQYYDGQFNDMRMNITIAKTAERYGAKLLNYTEVKDFIKENGKIKGVIFYDKIEDKNKEAFAKVVINATGPFTDTIRKLDNPHCEEIMQVSSGIHIAVDKSYAPRNEGLLIPKTEDGRVLFILPWEDACIIGTTDEPAEVDEYPKAKEKEIDYLIRHINMYFDVKVTKDDIKSVWSGLRPLVKNSSTNDTASIVRDHYIKISESNLVTITGGKWTTFRKMAEDTINYIIPHFKLSPKNRCITEEIIYYGSEGFDENYKNKLLESNYFDKEILNHLIKNYGTKTEEIIHIAQKENLGDKLLESKPIILAEIIYAIRKEYARKPLDFLVRRTSLAETDLNSAKKALDTTVEIFSKELDWDNETKNNVKAEALKILSDAI